MNSSDLEFEQSSAIHLGKIQTQRKTRNLKSCLVNSMMTIPHLTQHMNGFLPFPCFTACRNYGIVGDDIQRHRDLLHLTMSMLDWDWAPKDMGILIQIEKSEKVLDWICKDTWIKIMAFQTQSPL